MNIAPNTYKFTDRGGHTLTGFHDVIIADEYTDYKGRNVVRIATQGHKTVTTKDRLNKILANYGCSIHVIGRGWYVYARGDERRVAFVENMIVLPDGKFDFPNGVKA